ncbi:MAG: hypothetical protein ACJA2W_003496 [Planctomycetota bacterium]|jgi:hypothetical protein
MTRPTRPLRCAGTDVDVDPESKVGLGKQRALTRCALGGLGRYMVW